LYMALTSLRQQGGIDLRFSFSFINDAALHTNSPPDAT